MRRTLAFLTALLSLALVYNAYAEQKWLTAKSNHFIVYYRNAPERFIDKLIDQVEYCYDEIADDLGFRRHEFWLWDNRAKIYVYNDARDYQVSTGLPIWSQGAAVPKDKVIQTFLNEKGFFDIILPHEMGHIIFREFVGFNNRAVPIWLDEGVASYQERRKRGLAKNIVKDAIKKETFIPLVKLSRINPKFLSDRGTVNLFYAESITIVEYLIKQFGRESFVFFCQNLRDKKNLDAAIRSAYPFEDIEELDEAWQKYLK